MGYGLRNKEKENYMKKKVLAALLGACMMATLLTGCNTSSTGDSANTGDTASDSSSEASQEEIPEDTGATVTDWTVSYDGIKTGIVNARVSVHDPSIIQVGEKYYIFGSHMEGGWTENLRSWTKLGNGYKTNNSVYGNLWDTSKNVFEYAGDGNSLIPTDDGGTHVWAPDACYNPTTGLYYLYYCTTSTWNASNLCYATSKTVEGPYEWQGPLIYSGFTSSTIRETDVLDYVSESYAANTYINEKGAYDSKEWPNAIDPSIFFDEDGRWWMVYGSWSGGIYLLELDTQTGKVIHPEADPANDVDAYFGKKLLGGGHKSIEGPYILYDKTSGYYYLFVSYGTLTREGGYQIRVFRSETVDGEYVDMNGKKPTGGNHASFGLKMSGNYMLPSLKQAYMATGHNSAFIDKNDGKMYIVYHTRFDNGSETHSPRVKQFFLNEEGWPCMLPYATNGETISETGYERDEVVGLYYFINQGYNVNANIAKPIMLELTAGGGVYGDGVEGTWSMTEGTYYMKITVDGKEYSGVFCKQTDEAGTDVMTFSAVGENVSVWGVKYYE